MSEAYPPVVRHRLGIPCRRCQHLLLHAHRCAAAPAQRGRLVGGGSCSRRWRLHGAPPAHEHKIQPRTFSRTYTRHPETARKRERLAQTNRPKRKHSPLPTMSGSPVPRSPLIVNRPADELAALTEATSNVSRSVVALRASRRWTRSSASFEQPERDAVYAALLQQQHSDFCVSR